jgi:hypothetical protein
LHTLHLFPSPARVSPISLPPLVTALLPNSSPSRKLTHRFSDPCTSSASVFSYVAVIDGYIRIFNRQPGDNHVALEAIPCHALTGVEVESYGSAGQPASVCVLTFSCGRQPIVMAVEAKDDADDKLDNLKVPFPPPLPISPTPLLLFSPTPHSSSVHLTSCLRRCASKTTVAFSPACAWSSSGRLRCSCCGKAGALAACARSSRQYPPAFHPIPSSLPDAVLHRATAVLRCITPRGSGTRRQRGCCWIPWLM